LKVFEEMDSFPSCGGDSKVWMRDKVDHHECTAVCVDDLVATLGDPGMMIKVRLETCKFKLKGISDSSEISYHLGCDCFRDDT
jgi:hypothetical protein